MRASRSLSARLATLGTAVALAAAGLVGSGRPRRQRRHRRRQHPARGPPPAHLVGTGEPDSDHCRGDCGHHARRRSTPGSTFTLSPPQPHLASGDPNATTLGRLAGDTLTVTFNRP